MNVLKVYKPISNHVFDVLTTTARETENVNANVAAYLKREAVKIAANVVMEDVKALLAQIDKLEERLKWLKKLVKANKARTPSPEELEKRFRIVEAIKKQLDTTRLMIRMAQKLPAEERNKVVKELEKAEKRLTKMMDQALQILHRLAKGAMPPEVKNLGDRIKAFFARRLPRKGTKIKVQYSAMPLSDLIRTKTPRILFGYHLIFQRVPKFSNPKASTNVVVSVLLEADSEGAKIPYVAVSKELTSLTHLRKVPLKAKTWKEALRVILREAAAHDALLVNNPLKLKPRVSAFRSRGFKLDGIKISVEKGNVLVEYKIGTHRELKGSTRRLDRYDGYDVHVLKDNDGSVREIRTTQELDKLILLATAEALRVKPINLKLVKTNIDPKKKTVTYYFRFIVTPEDVEEKGSK